MAVHRRSGRVSRGRGWYGRAVEPPPPSFGARIVFAYVCFFRVLFDAAFAGRLWAVRDAMPELPAPKKIEADEPPAMKKKDTVVEAKKVAARSDTEKQTLREQGALAALALFQREGRLVDFLKQDITSFGDDEIGAAVRVVHAGCKKTLEEHAEVEPIRSEAEGAQVTLDDGFDRAAHKLTGKVEGSAPYSGTLRHKGWRARRFELSTPTEGHDPSVLAPAEVEL